MSDSTTAPVRDTADKAADAVKDAGSAAASTAKKAEASVEKTAAAATATTAAAVEKTAATVEKKAATVEKKAAAAVEGDKPQPPQRSVAEIQADLDATRARLAGRIDDLQEYVAPKNVANRQFAKVKGVFVDEFGGIKPDRVLIAAGVVVGLVVVVGLSRRRSS